MRPATSNGRNQRDRGRRDGLGRPGRLRLRMAYRDDLQPLVARADTNERVVASKRPLPRLHSADSFRLRNSMTIAYAAESCHEGFSCERRKVGRIS